VEDIRGQVCSAKIRQVQGETQMQWIWTKEGKKIEPAMCVGSGLYGQKLLGKVEKKEE